MTVTPPGAFIPHTDLDEARAVNAQLALMPHPDVSTAEGLAQIRTAFAPPGASVLRPADVTFDGPGGTLRLRIIRPEETARAAFFNMHGGGWCLGRPEDDDGINEQFALHCQVATVSVDYRLAPEHPFPAGLDDCVAAIRWLIANMEAEFGTERLVIGGNSAGAHLAALMLMQVRDTLSGASRVAAACFLFGCFDVSGTPSQRMSTAALVIPRAFLDQLTGHDFWPAW